MSRKHRGEASWIVVAQTVRPGTRRARGTIISVRVVSPGVAAKRCIPSPVQRRVIEDEQFVIFSEPGRQEADQSSTKYLACVYGGNGIQAEDGLPELWQAAWGQDLVEPLVAAGPYLAWQSASSSRYESSGPTEIEVLDVPEDKVVADRVISRDNPYESGAHAVALALDSEGHVAWRAINPIRESVPYAIQIIGEDEAVEAIGEDGQALTLESGSLGSFGGLGFEPAGTLHWSSNGTARTYTFPMTAGA